MKTRKIIGLLVACGGVVASFAAASALYKKEVDDLHVGIGASYTAQTGSVTYKINGLTSGTITPTYLTSDGTNDGHYFGDSHPTKGLYTQAHFAFPLSATYASFPQEYVLGNFSITISNLLPQLQNHVDVYACVSGFGDDYNIYSEGENPTVIGSKWGKQDLNTVFGSDHLMDSASYTFSKDITVEATQAQQVDLYVKIDHEVNAAWWDANMLTLAESTPFDVSVSWGEHSDSYQVASIVGEQTEWQHDEVYDMVPNMKSNDFEWYFKGLSGFGGGAKAKVHKNLEAQSETWSADPNYSCDSSKTYNVYWNGSNSSAASFVEQA